MDVLASVPVEGAVFTTFTLSLAWFETHLLRSLERAGAKQVLLLADPVGVNASLGEGLVTGPGVRYSIEPVEAPNGAFHAKVGILWSRESLVIAVGSGNFTFAGMHRNLECWEVLTAGVPSSGARQLHRSVADDVLAFVEHLKGRVEPGGRAASTLTAATSAITSWLARLPATPCAVRWIDSTREPIGEQVVRHLGASATRTLQVLSPFHDRDGSAIDRLASRLGATKVDVLFTGSTTTYPLGPKANERGVATQLLKVEDQSRPLHAKVFHVIDDGTAHVLSGSANATSQALWTTGNTEVSLLRRGSFDDVLPTAPGSPTVKFVEYKPPKRRLLAIQWARASDDHVRAHVRWLGDDAPAKVHVGFVDSLDAPVPVDWPADGIVRVRLPTTFNPLHPRALRIEVVVVHDEHRWVARAWVAFDEILNASREFRAALSAWNKLLVGDENDEADYEDDAVLLRIFAEEHADTIDAIGSGQWEQRRTHPKKSDGNDEEETSIPLRLIDALTRVPLPSGTPTGGSIGTLIDDVEQAMRAAFAALEEPTILEDDEDDDEPGAPRAKRARPKLGKAVRQALDAFEAAFVEAANALESEPAKPAHVLAYSSLCMRLVLRYRLRDGENRMAFWTSAATLVRTILCPLSNRAPLVSLLHAPGTPLAEDAARLLALLVALLAWRDAGGRLDGEGASSGQPMRAEVIREALAALDRAAESTVRPSALPRSIDEVFPDPPAKLAEVLEQIRQIPSASERALALKAHIEKVIRGEVPPAATGPEREIGRDARRRPPLFVTPWVPSCLGCHKRLAGVIRGRLLLRQPVQCLNTRCSRWLVPSEGA